jgi:hypothetical protein
VAAAARICHMSRVDAALAAAAVVVVIRHDGIPVVTHTLNDRADLPALLRTVADGLEQGARNGD